MGQWLMDTAKMDEYVHTSICSVLPDFSLLAPSDLRLTQLHSGTNTVFRVDAPGQQSLIFRKFGSCPLIDRKAEHRTFLRLAECGLGPRCLGLGAGFRLEELLSGTPIGREDMPDLLEQIAAKVATLHSLEKGSGVSWINGSIQHWGQLFENTAREYQARLSDDRKVLLAELLESLREEKNSALALVPDSEGLVFSHNDVSYTNILRHSTGIHLVDYEYSSLCVPASDLATVANEMTYDYMAPAPQYFRFCPEEELTREQTNALVETYCREAGESEERVWGDFYKCRAAIHFVGFLWSACMYQPRDPAGFDLLKYAHSRLAAYRSLLAKLP